MASLQSAPAGGKVAGNGEERTPAAAAAPGASEELLPMLHQVGGHRAASDEEAPYMLRLRPHLVLKIVQDGARGERELGFYRRLFPEVDGGGGDGDGDGGGGRQSPAGGGDDDGLAFLRPFVPAFYGVRTIQSPPHRPDAPLFQYLALEDIADRDRHLPMPPSSSPKQRFAPSSGRTGDKSSRGQRPSVLDIKMGRATHGPFASPGKAARERGKYPHQAEVGFRVIGMKVYDRAAGEYETEDKAYGRGLTPNGIDDALARFFLRRCCPQPPPQATSDDSCLSPSPLIQATSDDEEGRGHGNGRSRSRRRGKRAAATELLDFYIERLEALHDWFQGQRLARFWSSSLLFVDHEEDSLEEEEEEEEEEEDGVEKEDGRRMVADVRMIDFAHVELLKEEKGEGDGAAELALSTPVAEDENYVYGLVSLLEHLRRLRRRAAAMEQAAAIGLSGEG